MPATQGAQTLEAFEEALTCAQRLQSARWAQAIPRRYMAALDRLGRLPNRAVESAPNVHGCRHRPLDGLDIRLMVVSDDRARYLACAAERLLEERFSGCGVAVLSQLHFDHLAV